jgi:hypothetical protein
MWPCWRRDARSRDRSESTPTVTVVNESVDWPPPPWPPGIGYGFEPLSEAFEGGDGAVGSGDRNLRDQGLNSAPFGVQNAVQNRLDSV